MVSIIYGLPSHGREEEEEELPFLAVSFFLS